MKKTIGRALLNDECLFITVDNAPRVITLSTANFLAGEIQVMDSFFLCKGKNIFFNLDNPVLTEEELIQRFHTIRHFTCGKEEN